MWTLPEAVASPMMFCLPVYWSVRVPDAETLHCFWTMWQSCLAGSAHTWEKDCSRAGMRGRGDSLQRLHGCPRILHILVCSIVEA